MDCERQNQVLEWVPGTNTVFDFTAVLVSYQISTSTPTKIAGIYRKDRI